MFVVELKTLFFCQFFFFFWMSFLFLYFPTEKGGGGGFNYRPNLKKAKNSLSSSNPSHVVLQEA